MSHIELQLKSRPNLMHASCSPWQKRNCIRGPTSGPWTRCRQITQSEGSPESASMWHAVEQLGENRLSEARALTSTPQPKIAYLGNCVRLPKQPPASASRSGLMALFYARDPVPISTKRDHALGRSIEKSYTASRRFDVGKGLQ